MPRPLLMGLETEYAVTAFVGEGRSEAGGLVERFISTASNLRPFVVDGLGSPRGIFLSNGARFYVDAGLHPEYATPECSTPREVVAHVRAGDRLLLEVADDIAQHARRSRSSANASASATIPALDELAVFRCNVAYDDPPSTWGSHSSYLHRENPRAFPDRLIPHLVSRIVYSGAGGFIPTSSGTEFTLSPRVWMLEQVISSESTQARGIYHTKNETLSKEGYHRLHVLCGDSVCSDLALLLRVGTTALVVATIDGGGMESSDVQLAAPLEAMRAIARDVECRTRVALVSGDCVSAIDLQRRYLSKVNAYRRRGGLPDWAGEICTLWEEVLEQLEEGSPTLETRLDWPMKYALYRRWAGCDDWSRLARYGAIHAHVRRRLLAAVGKGGGQQRRFDLELLIGEQSPVPDEVARLERYLHARDADWDGLRACLKLRAELLEIDVRFGQLGPRGIHEQLQAAHPATTPLIDPEDVARAAVAPPPVGRAKVRGDLVKSIHHSGGGTSHGCAWSRVWNARDGSYADLSDPFETEARWSTARVDEDVPPRLRDLQLDMTPFFLRGQRA
ncbi:MAG: proteasome accessory factor PafA2 family protein [Gemmatimonadaceae bacterium]|nr:proteasome accessory factor PafA2 family protein [Gemmatimonadaceae bacterium]